MQIVTKQFGLANIILELCNGAKVVHLSNDGTSFVIDCGTASNEDVHEIVRAYFQKEAEHERQVSLATEMGLML